MHSYEVVKKNLEKFPDRFSWKLTEDEKKYLWSKFSTANISKKRRTNPTVFTEQGVYMLATILKSKVATEVTIAITDAFVLMKKYISQYHNIEFININPFHDRYIILDRNIVYSSGMSLKDVGKSYSYINREHEEIFVHELLKIINDMMENID